MKKGQRFTQEHKRNLSLSHLGHPGFWLGKKRSRETIQKIADKKRGSHLSEQARRNISLSHKGRIVTYETRAKIAASLKGHPPTYRGGHGIMTKPNIPERELFSLLEETTPGKFRYNNGWFVLGGRCPDFVNIDGKKQLIELFGDYWHSFKVIGMTREEAEAERINYFKQYGFDCIIVWESELVNEEKVKQKLLTIG